MFSSPPPEAAWLIDSGRLELVSRSRDGAIAVDARPLAAGALELGPVGLMQVKAELLGGAMQELLHSAVASQRSALILPSAWVRTIILAFDTLPRSDQEVDEMLRWRLKKLLPVPASELAIDWIEVAPFHEQRQLLVFLLLQRSLNGLEQAFDALNLSVGIITSRLQAIAMLFVQERPRLLIQQETSSTALALIEAGTIRMVRTKALPPGDRQLAQLAREMMITRDFLAKRFGIGEGLQVTITASDPVFAREISSWWSVHGEAEVIPAPQAPVDLGGLDEVSRCAAGAVLKLIEPEAT
jgi:hypothetical protein